MTTRRTAEARLPVSAQQPPTRAVHHLDGLLEADVALLAGLHAQVLVEAGLRASTQRAGSGGDPDAPRRIVDGLGVEQAARLAQARSPFTST